MKVALELQPCYWERTGIGTYTYELAKRMRNKDGVEFCGNVFNFLGRKNNEELMAGITMPVRENKLLHYGIYRRMWRYLPVPHERMFPGKVDLSVFFNFIVPPNIQGKVITTVHDLTYLRYPETMKKSNYQHLTRGMDYSVKRSDRIVTVSHFSKQEIQKYLEVPEEKISVVYNAPSLTEGTADYDAVCEKYGIRGDYILFVGTIEPRKNVARLLRAFDLLKGDSKIPHQLVLAGGKGWQDEHIFQTLQSIKCSDDIVFTGYVSAEEKNTFYQNASVFVFPSIYEGFGIPPLEAMTWGCPGVCTDAAAVPEVVGEAAELADPLDEASIAGGILRILSDHDYASELIQKGKLRAKEFSWERSAESLFAVCKEVLQE